jgi:hypothetical protein
VCEPWYCRFDNAQYAQSSGSHCGVCCWYCTPRASNPVFLCHQSLGCASHE